MPGNIDTIVIRQTHIQKNKVKWGSSPHAIELQCARKPDSIETRISENRNHDLLPKLFVIFHNCEAR